MSVRHLDALFGPRSVAVAGGAGPAARVRERVLGNLERGGFPGPIRTLDPAGPPGAEARRVAELPEPPELAVVCAPPAEALAWVEALGAAGTRAVVLPGVPAGSAAGTGGAAALSAGAAADAEGFAPGGPPGGPAAGALRRATRRHGLRVLGPGTLGVLAPGARLDASVSPVPALTGRLALVTQSAAFATAALDWARAREIGFSKVVSLGASADVDVGDCLDFLATDPDTAAVLLYLEAANDARELLSAGRAASRNKPVVVVKAGRHGDGTASGDVPDGSRAPADAVYDAAFRRAGMLRVDTMAELFAAVETLARTRPFVGPGVAVVGNGRGPGALAADTLRKGRGRLAVLGPESGARLAAALPGVAPSNPLDLGDDAEGDHYRAALGALQAAPEVEALVVLHAPSALADAEATARAAAEAVSSGRRRLPVLTSWLGDAHAAAARRVLHGAGLPTYDTPEQAAAAFLHLAGWRRSQGALTEVPASRPAVRVHSARARKAIEAALGRGAGALAPAEARALLAAYGVPLRMPPGPEEGSAEPRDGDVRVTARVDPVFGPVLRLAPAGRAGEASDDATVELPPLNAALARAMVERIGAGRRLREAGGAAREDALGDLLVAVARLVAEQPAVEALDLVVPLSASADVHARALGVGVARPRSAASERLAILPYPSELEETLRLRDGGRIHVRPIRPEDEPAHLAFFRKLDPEDVRRRFFGLVREVPHAWLARYTQIDYDREMAFVAREAVGAAEAETLGVVRTIEDADRDRAEFAIVIRSDQKGRGLGRALLRKALRYCRARGVGEVVGEILPHNRAMLGLAASLGFRLDGRDGHVVRAALPLVEPEER